MRVMLDGDWIPAGELASKLGPLSGILTGLTANSEIRLNHDGERCPHCGTTKVSLLDSGLTGCALCYVVFERTIQSELLNP